MYRVLIRLRNNKALQLDVNLHKLSNVHTKKINFQVSPIITLKRKKTFGDLQRALLHLNIQIYFNPICRN